MRQILASPNFQDEAWIEPPFSRSILGVESVLMEVMSFSSLACAQLFPAFFDAFL